MVVPVLKIRGEADKGPAPIKPTPMTNGKTKNLFGTIFFQSIPFSFFEIRISSGLVNRFLF
jgi:hypothetical protein